MPRPPKRVKGNTLTRFFDGDESKADKLRGLMLGKQMRRRDGDGRTVAEHRLDEIKGRPPKVPQPSGPPQPPPRNERAEKANK